MGTLNNITQAARQIDDKVPERLTGTPRISYSTLVSDKRLVFDRTGSNPVLVDFLQFHFVRMPPTVPSGPGVALVIVDVQNDFINGTRK